MFSKSLETDSVKDARRKADAVWDAQLLMWQAKLDGRAGDARAAYEAMRKIAQSRGFNYLPLSDVVNLSDEALLGRIEAVQTIAGVPSKDEASALLGSGPINRLDAELLS